MGKRIISLVLALTMLVGMVPVFALNVTAESTFVVGNNVTIPNKDVPADGTNKYCNCKGLAVGSGKHKCCWNYAAQVYDHIWGETFSRYTTTSHYLRNVSAEERKFTADNLRKYLKNAAAGAILRIDVESSATAGDGDGHSLIFLRMSSSVDGAHFLEGNYDGHGRTRIKLWSFNDLVSHYGSRYKYIKYIMWPNAEAYKDVDDHIDTEYRCYGWLEVTSNTAYVKSMPCSRDSDPKSEDVAKAEKGANYVAIRMVKNEFGKYWYKVADKNNPESKAIGYVYAGDVKFSPASDLMYPEITTPAEISTGQSLPITGTLSSDHQKITEIEVLVYSDETGELATSKTVTIDATKYNLSNIHIDPLKAGSYTVWIYVTLKSAYSPDGDTLSHAYAKNTNAPPYIGSFKVVKEPELCRITFQPLGGTMPGLISSNTLDGVNVAREVGFLVVYNNSGALVDTNKYGVEVLVDSTGKVTGRRDYLSETKQYVPTGGFVLSGQGENGTWVKEIPIGAYVAYDELDMQVYVYETKEAMQVNHKYVKENETYGALPVPTYEGHVFSGWILWGGKPINYYSAFEGEELFATWEENYDLTPVKTMEYNGHIYELYDHNVSWTEAKALCENMGGHLVTITDAAEQEKVLALTASGTRGLYKIGASDAETEGQWKWVTGETFSYNNWDKSAPEPNGGTNENYGNLIAIDNPPNKQRGEWVDDQNAKLGSFYDMSNTGFICEYEAVCSHDYKQVVTKPTCTASGYTTYTCSKCGDSYIGSPTNALGHSYGQWTTVTAATCTKEGSEKSTCSGCGDVKTQVIPAPGHSYVSETVDATCTEYGKIIYTCTKCGDSYVEYTGGEFTDWSTTKPSGVEESQIETRTEYRYQTKEFTTGTSSTMDGWTQYDSTSSWGDYGVWSEWSDTKATANDSTKVETRTVYKYYYYKCPSCGDHMHGWGLTCPTWADGCGKGELAQGDYVAVWSTTPYDQVTFKDFYGTGKYYATVDGQRVFKHSNQESKTQYRFCTREQKTEYKFYRWSAWSDWSATAVEANDNTKVETRTVYRYMTGKLGDHDYKEVITKPTCTAEGYTTFTCMECGDRYEGARVSATGHHYTYTVTQKPSEKATGALTGICDSCNDIATETLPGLNKTDYTYTVVKEPTYTETGVAKWTWNVDTYGQIAIETDLEKLEVKLTGIEIKAAPSKTKYEIGEALDTTGLTLLVRYSDGSTKTVTDGFTIGTFDSSTAGEKTVTVSYGGKTASFTVTVEKAEEPKPSAAQLVVGSATATVGSAVELDVSIANNPGFSVLNIAFVYDTQYLTLTEVENQLSSMTMTSDTTVVWDAVENYSEDGKLCTLKFEIAEDAPDGEYEIRVLFISASNEVFEELEMSGVSGTLEIRNILYGDANGDGKISSVDLAMLRKYIASVNPLTGESNIAVKAGADCNGDGKIASVDLAMLRKYLASLNPITGESTVVLGPR